MTIARRCERNKWTWVLTCVVVQVRVAVGAQAFEYSTLDGTSPNTMSIGCQSSYLTLPRPVAPCPKWELAPNDPHAVEVAARYQWGTACLVLQDGSSIPSMRNSAVSGLCQSTGQLEGATAAAAAANNWHQMYHYKVGKCHPAKRILIRRTCPQAGTGCNGTLMKESTSTGTGYIYNSTGCIDVSFVNRTAGTGNTNSSEVLCSAREPISTAASFGFLLGLAYLGILSRCTCGPKSRV